MVLITTIDRVEKERPNVHDLSPCSAAIFISGQNKYLQLATFGSPARQDKGTVSQTLQFDRESATVLLRLLRVAFPERFSD